MGSGRNQRAVGDLGPDSGGFWVQAGRVGSPTEAQAGSCGMIAALVSDFSVDVTIGGGSLAAVRPL